jgi:hypothetical protein
MTRGLIAHLKANPDIEQVYLNAQGGWLFDPNKLHPVIKSRQEILDMEDSLPVETITQGDLSTIQEEYGLLRDKCDLLELENQILTEGKDKDTEQWAKERAEYQEKIRVLETQLTAVSAKNKKFNATT